MAILFFLLNTVCIGLFCLAVGRSRALDGSPCFRESLVYSTLLVCMEIWFFTEVASAFQLLSMPVMAALHGISAVVFGVASFFFRKHLTVALNEFREPSKHRDIRKVVFLLLLLFPLPLGMIAVYMPPATPDAMTYHLPRILHWIQNASVAPYPCGEPRQIFHPPFAEYMILQTEILSGNDVFDNLVQVVMMGIAAVLVSLLAKEFGLKAQQQTFAVIVLSSAPILIVQAAQAQTDVTATCFFLGFLYFGLKSLRQTTGENSFDKILFRVACMGVFLSLGINVKFTVAVFAIPFCVWLGIRYVRQYQGRAVPIALLLLFLFLLFNGPFFYRNFALTGSPFGPRDHNAMHLNAVYSPGVTVSNALRNLGFQFMFPSSVLNEANVGVMTFLHQLIGCDLNDPNSSFNPVNSEYFKYAPIFSFDDIRLGSPFLLLLIFAAISVALHRWRSGCPSPSSHPEPAFHFGVYALLLLSGFLIYCTLFRWQPFGGRLQLPCWAAFSPFVTYYLFPRESESNGKIRFLLFLLPGIVCVGLLLYKEISYDPVRSFVTTPDQLPTANDLDFQYDKLQSQGFRGNMVYVHDTESIGSKGRLLCFPKIVDEIMSPQNTFWETYLLKRRLNYFRYLTHFTPVYTAMHHILKQQDAKKVGVVFFTQLGCYEYPTFAFLTNKRPSAEFRWCLYPDYFESTTAEQEPFVPEWILIDSLDHIGKLQEKYILKNVFYFGSIILVEVEGSR